MANEKNKINELVLDDDDPTVELEALTLHPDGCFDLEVERESDAHTFNFEHPEEVSAHSGDSLSELRSDLATRTRTIGKLQVDIEQLRSKWLGLETEIKAREEITNRLANEVDELKDELLRKQKLLKKRDYTIKSLKSEIRQRDEAYRLLAQQNADVEQKLADRQERDAENLAALEKSASELAKLQARFGDSKADDSPAIVVAEKSSFADSELREKLEKSDEYADSLRRKMQDLIESRSDLERDKDHLEHSLAELVDRNIEISDALASANETVFELQARLENKQSEHEQEIRTLRFELGQAQDTVAQTHELNNQLASDLVDTRGFKEELERMLTKNEERAGARIEELEKDLGKLSRATEQYEQKLESKSAAINVLLAELAKKTDQIQSIAEIDDVVQDIDGRMSERFDEPPMTEDTDRVPAPVNAERERITRVLIGRIGDQVLRFPLFKDRLTIGRTEDNDIQLKASYISRRHAVVLAEGDTTRVIDWGSKNGVFVNANRVKEHFLSHGDIVSVGNVKLRYEERLKRDAH